MRRYQKVLCRPRKSTRDDHTVATKYSGGKNGENDNMRLQVMFNNVGRSKRGLPVAMHRSLTDRQAVKEEKYIYLNYMQVNYPADNVGILCISRRLSGVLFSGMFKRILMARVRFNGKHVDI